MLTKIAEFLGTTSPTLKAGYTKSKRGPRMPVCRACGALVAYEAQTLHRAWHHA